MRVFKAREPRTAADDRKLTETVAEIILNVRQHKDSAVSDYNQKFGGAAGSTFLVPQEELTKAYENLPAALRGAMEAAAANIKKFALMQQQSLHSIEETETMDGVFLGQKIIPVDSCCCYIPGGSHPLFSTALMLVIPAKCAGVARVCAAVPPMAGSTMPHPATLAALKIAGADEVYAAGGAQAIAAFAYGTESIAPVSMIVGPGNKYVTEAKRQVYGQVGIDFLAGPSEVLVIADKNARADIVAADMLAQSEHDGDAAAILITDSPSLAESVCREIDKQLKEHDTAATASLSWRQNGMVLIADSLKEAAMRADSLAPEHLEVNVADPEAILPLLRNFGSLFIGEGAAEVFGDYAAGTNHTLPTMKAARYSGGLSVMTFLKVCTFQRVTAEGAALLAPIAETMAAYEGLSAHAKAAAIRKGR